MAVLTSNILFFIVMFIFAVFETYVVVSSYRLDIIPASMNSFVSNLLPFLRISTPLSMDMFAWTRKEAVFYNGIIICCIGFESILVFLVVKVASQRYPHLCMSGLTKIVLSPLINVAKIGEISFQSRGSTCVACRLSHHILWLFYSTSMGKSLSKNTMGR